MICVSMDSVVVSGEFKGALGDAPKDFLVPKCRLKRRLIGYYCYLILMKITKFVATCQDMTENNNKAACMYNLQFFKQN